jgi:hypothetical protein
MRVLARFALMLRRYMEGVCRLHDSELDFSCYAAACKFTKHLYTHRHCIPDVCLVNLMIPRLRASGIANVN